MFSVSEQSYLKCTQEVSGSLWVTVYPELYSDTLTKGGATN